MCIRDRYSIIIYLGISVLHAQNLNTDKEGTSISFKIKNLGLNVNGTFSEFNVKANFDVSNLQDSYFIGTATISSIDTGIKARDKHLQENEYFHSEQYPEIELTSEKLKKLSDGQYEFTGKLSIKGKTKTVVFPISVENTGNSIIAKGNFEINRLDFKVGKSSWVLRKKVKVSIVYKGNL